MRHREVPLVGGEAPEPAAAGCALVPVRVNEKRQRDGGNPFAGAVQAPGFPVAPVTPGVNALLFPVSRGASARFAAPPRGRCSPGARRWSCLTLLRASR